MEILIISIPLISSLNILIFSKHIGKLGGMIISISSIIMSSVISIIKLLEIIKYNEIYKIKIIEWFIIGINKTNIEILIDKKSIIMMNLISIITSIIIIYSIYYMKEEEERNRFISLLLLFSVTMLILISSNSLIFLYIGWEGVGIMSYLLINFWFHSINSNKSSIKAILYNKIGDISLLFTLILLYLFNNSSNFYNIINISLSSFLSSNILNLLLLGIIIASIAKSAQIILHGWLGDAMAGPTPVSALLHAATMVTAGVFILFRLEPLFYYMLYNNIYIFYNININDIILLIGLITIIFGGISSINQLDIKKIIAYSTCSQLGYMFITTSINSSFLGFFHLFTHAFFKALLFLSAGIIIHNISNIQDIRKYGSLIFKLPLTYIFILISSFSLFSLPFFSGYYSKDIIIEYSFLQNKLYIYIFLVLGAVLTFIYSYKLILYTFILKPLNSSKFIYFNKFPEISFFYLIFLFILFFSSIFIGYIFKDYLISLEYFNFKDFEFLPYYIKLVPLILIILFIFIYPLINLLNFKYYYNLFIIFNRRFFIDSLINYFFINFSQYLSYSFFFKFIDKGFLEFFGPVGLFRLFYFFPKYYSINKQSYLNINLLFIYLFISFFLLFLFSFLW